MGRPQSRRGCHGVADHTSRKGFERDAIKFNLARSQGWTVFVVTSWLLATHPQETIERIADFVRDRIDDRAALEEAWETMAIYADGVVVKRRIVPDSVGRV